MRTSRALTPALSVVAAYASFVIATDLGGSGIIATAIAGLAVGTWVVPNLRASEGRVSLVSFWSVVVYVANSVIFLAMGLLFGASGGAATSKAFTTPDSMPK